MLNVMQNQPSSALDNNPSDPSQSDATKNLQFLEQLLEMIQYLLQQMQNQGGDDDAPPVGSKSSASPASQPYSPDSAPQQAPQAPPAGAQGGQQSTQAPPPPPVTSDAQQPSSPPAQQPSQASSVTSAQQTSGGDMSPSDIASKYHDQIMSASQSTGIPPGIIAGQIWQESKGIASTPGGGLMQLGDNEFQQYGGGDISNPADNIKAGANYMKALSSQFGGNMGAALRAYNSGPNGVDLNNLNSTPAGTGDPTYVQKVMQAAQQSGLATT
ncbi:transglycosylase SLT domain-containing protein [Paraburkholderia acidicola]|uniref:Transglycosylase SLT domain-containing protein n=1 Tax=Paraburkholderia acidicola TaxID=1912599 RepID=A0ABV1LM23_9BURK